MKLRPFGKTGIDVSEIGLGAWQLANPDWNLHDTAEALRIVRASLDAGCNFFDTAPGYGYGNSEELLGQGLKGVRQNVVICTKFSHHGADGADDFSVEQIRPVLEGSLRRLQTDYVDILLLHNPPRELMDGSRAPQYAELERMLIAFWRRRLKLEEIAPDEAIRRMRNDATAGPILRQLEVWMHSPHRDPNFDLGSLLRPLEKLSASEVDWTGEWDEECGSEVCGSGVCVPGNRTTTKEAAAATMGSASRGGSPAKKPSTRSGGAANR